MIFVALSNSRMEKFNNNSDEGSFFHTTKWMEVLGKIDSINPNYFLFFRGNDVIGILPFIQSRKLYFNGYNPIPYSDSYHCIIQNEDHHILQYLLRELQKQKCSYVVLNTLNQDLFNTQTHFPQFPYLDFGNMVTDLKIFSPEKIWERISKRKKKKIQTFEKRGFAIKEITSLNELKLFYKFYAQNIKHIKGSLQPLSFFKILWDKLSPDDIRITLLSKGELIAGGAFDFKFMPKKTYYCGYMALNRGLSNKFSPSYLLYWDDINWAWNAGFKKISLGFQTPNTPNPRYQIKKDFAGDFIPTYSKIISLSRLFTLAYRSTRPIVKIHQNLQSRIQDSGKIAAWFFGGASDPRPVEKVQPEKTRHNTGTPTSPDPLRAE